MCLILNGYQDDAVAIYRPNCVWFLLVGFNELFNCLCSQKRATCDHTAGRREPSFLPFTSKNLRTLSSVSEVCLTTGHFRTRVSLHPGCNDRVLYRHGRCPAPSSGIARCDVVVPGMAATSAMALDAAVKSPVRPCAPSMNWQTMIAPTSRMTRWRNCYPLRRPPRGTALPGKCLLAWTTQILC